MSVLVTPGQCGREPWESDSAVKAIASSEPGKPLVCGAAGVSAELAVSAAPRYFRQTRFTHNSGSDMMPILVLTVTQKNETTCFFFNPQEHLKQIFISI